MTPKRIEELEARGSDENVPVAERLLLRELTTAYREMQAKYLASSEAMILVAKERDELRRQGLDRP